MEVASVELRGLLSSLTPAEREALLALARARRYERGAAVVRQGERADQLVILVEGRVKVVASTTQGTEILLAIRGPGDVLGELAILDGGPRSATVVALEDLEVLSIPGSVFQRFLGDHPSAQFRLLQLLSGRLRDASRKLVEQGAYVTETRVARRLLELAALHGEVGTDGTVRITVPLTQADLAGWVGASREGVNKALGTLREAGVIRTGRQAITVVDAERLREMAT